MEATLLWVLAAALAVVAFAGLIVPNVPAPPLLFGALLLAAWAEDFDYVGSWTLLVLGVLTALAIVADLLAGAWGARRFGASRYSVAGSVIGGLIGLFFGLPGVLLGPLVGAVLGEFAAGRKAGVAGWAGIGAALGFIAGVAVKAALMVSMVGVFLVVRLFLS